MWVPLLHRVVSPLLPDVLKVWDVVACPRPLLQEHVGDVGAPGRSRHSLRNPQRSVARRLARSEALVVNYHPLVVVRPALVPQLQLRPLLARRRKAGGHDGARVRQQALRPHSSPARPVVVLNACLHDSQTCVRDVEVVTAVEGARIGSEYQAARGGPGEGQVEVLDHPQHGAVLVPRHVPHPEVGVPGGGLDERAAVTLLGRIGGAVPSVMMP
mmetsp:Transcript_70116/g.208972  ORF Transcript_70116/g.208972 Transcript_70116/m.208972 type:complete len:214 (-) Transcript_70116:672-1313(-)